MITDIQINELSQPLEAALLEAENALEKASTPLSKIRMKKRRNAMKAACDALHRYLNA